MLKRQQCVPPGNCLNEVKKHCDGVDVGEGNLADCLSDLIAESELQEAESGGLSLRKDVHLIKNSILLMHLCQYDLIS